MFGQSGAGKSSLINLIAGREIAEVSTGTAGCTTRSQAYEVKLPNGLSVTLWDTVGLSEGFNGTVSTSEAIAHVYALIRRLGVGVRLLVFCVRGRIHETTIKNYQIFKAFCQGNVPIALVVTGLELVPDKKRWWTKNGPGFERSQMIFSDHACIVSTKGPKLDSDRFMHQEAYDISQKEVRDMITRACESSSTWRPEQRGWYLIVATSLARILPRRQSIEGAAELSNALKKLGLSKQQRQSAMEMYKSQIAADSQPKPDTADGGGGEERGSLEISTLSS